MGKFFEFTGCIHAHSIYSDGSGTYSEIIQSAQEADLDYLMISDHMTLKGRKKGYNGWHDDLFLSIGYEIQDPEDQNHYLAFGLEEELPSDLKAEEYIKAVEEKQALGIAAHPFEERDPDQSLNGYPPINWNTLEYSEIEVIEIWNMMSHWLEETTIKNSFWNLLHPRSFSTHPKQKALRWWDEVNQNKKVTAVGSVDAHATEYKFLGLLKKSIFDYKILFKSIRTHLLLDQKPTEQLTNNDIENILFANIKEGRNFISNYRRGDAQGFRYWAEAKNNKIQMGDSYVAQEVILYATIPKKAKVKVIRNGNVYKEIRTKEVQIKVPAGIYRLEIEVDDRGWIYTNHIKIRSPKK